MAGVILLAGVIVAAAIIAVARQIAAAQRSARRDRMRHEILQLLGLFAPARAAVGTDPRALLAWEPLAGAARRLFPEALAELDGALDGTFPFGSEAIEAAHARWTADWLAWERSHDAEYKLKAAAAEQALTDNPALQRERIDAVQRERLETYQRRYEEYVRVGKALQALAKR